MKNPMRTLLYDLFAAPVLRVLQRVLEWFGMATEAAKPDPAFSSMQNPATQGRQKRTNRAPLPLGKDGRSRSDLKVSRRRPE
jgi:hypothetical protein